MKQESEREGMKRVVEGCNLRYDRCQSHHAEYNLLEQTKIPLMPLCHPPVHQEQSIILSANHHLVLWITPTFTPFLPKPQTAHLLQPHPFPDSLYSFTNTL